MYSIASGHVASVESCQLQELQCGCMGLVDTSVSPSCPAEETALSLLRTPVKLQLFWTSHPHLPTHRCDHSMSALAHARVPQHSLTADPKSIFLKLSLRCAEPSKRGALSCRPLAEPHAVMLCRARTCCTTASGHTGTPPQRGSGRSTSSSEHSGRAVSGSHCDRLGFARHRTCFVNTAPGGSSFDSWRKPARAQLPLAGLGWSAA